MDRGAENYRRYLDGDDGGFVDIDIYPDRVEVIFNFYPDKVKYIPKSDNEGRADARSSFVSACVTVYENSK